MKDLKDYSLKAHNTFGIDAKCSRFLEFENEQEAQQVAGILRESDTPYIIIGGGSNLLLTKDFEGIVVRSGITGYRFEKDCRMVCGSGEVWDDIVALSIKEGYYGLENLSLIPGDVGASAVQNIGAYGVEAKDFIRQVHAVEIATGSLCVFSNEDCQYGYRDSRFKHGSLRTQTELCAVLDGFAEHIAGGNLRNAELRGDCFSLCAFAGTGRTQKNEIHIAASL